MGGGGGGLVGYNRISIDGSAYDLNNARDLKVGQLLSINGMQCMQTRCHFTRGL